MVETTLPPFATPDTLYALCRSADNRYALPFQASDVAAIIAQKKAYFNAEAEQNPLLREILSGGKVASADLDSRKHEGFLNGPATFFRTHEILRSTRKNRATISIGERDFERDQVVEMFERCVPNAQLKHLPWFSLSRYETSLGLAAGLALLSAFILGRDSDNGSPIDGAVLCCVGAVLLVAAFIYTTLVQNRDLRRPAAWNTCLYLDLNADLLTRDSPGLAAARKEFLPRQGMVKTHHFYYPLARQVEEHFFDAKLLLELPAEAVIRAR